MNKKIDKKVYDKWLNARSPGEAMAQLMKATDLGVSTLQKITSNNYKSEVKKPIRKAIAELLGVSEEKLWRDEK